MDGEAAPQKSKNPAALVKQPYKNLNVLTQSPQKKKHGAAHTAMSNGTAEDFNQHSQSSAATVAQDAGLRSKVGD